AGRPFCFAGGICGLQARRRKNGLSLRRVRSLGALELSGRRVFHQGTDGRARSISQRRSGVTHMPTLNLVQGVNDALKLEMRRDPRVVVLGEDVGKFGGVFRATAGLYEEFGGDRVIDTPLAENGIIGTALGMALYGLRPVPEIQFADFIFP